METTKVHFNKPQLRSDLIGAPTEILIAGRGTGKSEGVLAPKSAKCYLGTMPRGTGVVLGTTYVQLLERTLPAMIAGWERIGYRRGVHFLIGEKPPARWIKTWRWEGPYRPPLKFQHFISWWNGGGAHLVSQDRSGSSNGITIDWIIGDEAKLLNSERLRTELLPANRGIIPAFKNNPYHHGITFTTDMPVGTGGRWLLDYAAKMDREVVNRIWEIQVVRYRLNVLAKSAGSDKVQKEIIKQIVVFDEELQDLRQGLLYFHEASTLDNIHALGIEYIKQQIRDTTTFQFDTQILNLRPLKLEQGYYPDFDEEHHGYFSRDNGFLDSLQYDFARILTADCRKDGDYNPNLPLHIALDYNRRIHPLVIGQVYGNEIRIIKAMHSLYPQKLKDVIRMFIDYYKPVKNRYVHYWYDQTAVGDQHETRICDDVVRALEEGGWGVEQHYIGKNTLHEARYRMFGHLLTEQGHYPYRLRINRENCPSLITSINLAPAELRKDGYGKDKRTERDPNFPAEESTHYSEALDTLATGILESGQSFGDAPTVGHGVMMI